MNGYLLFKLTNGRMAAIAVDEITTIMQRLDGTLITLKTAASIRVDATFKEVVARLEAVLTDTPIRPTPPAPGPRLPNPGSRDEQRHPPITRA